MQAENRQKMKLVKMLELLKQETSEENPLRTNDLVQRIEDMGISVDRRTLSKDVAILNECGYEVNIRQIGHQKAYYMKERSFSISELKILIDAVQAASFITQEQTAEFIDKIAGLGGSSKAEILRGNVVCFNTVKHTNVEIYKNIAVLETALSGRRMASFFYFKRDENGNRVYRKDKKRYLVEPMALIFNDDNYYLMTWSSKYGKIVNYRVDRMDEVSVEGESVSAEAIMEDRDIAAFTEQAFKMYGGDPMDLVLEFEESLIDVVHDKFGERTKMIRTTRGKCVASVRVQVSPTFWGWIFQFAGEMKILSPETLMDQYRERARRVAEMTGDDEADEEEKAGVVSDSGGSGAAGDSGGSGAAGDSGGISESGRPGGVNGPGGTDGVK